MVIQNGAILKSEGELVNSERMASIITKMVNVSTSEALVSNEKFSNMVLNYPSHYYTISCNDQYIFVVKKKQTVAI
uniref:Late endosomal/lysosomal adaptor and MAPK and MTOR activator 4 n=1 Tax=Acrobeloides nanus TaxID=290746 RepID=A0A914E763_9BILA